MATTKKVVQASSSPAPSKRSTSSPASAGAQPAPHIQISAENKGKARMYRTIAIILWVLSIGLELFGIFYVLRRVPFTNTWLIVLIGVLVVCAVLTIVGSQLWKKANHLDPPSEKNKVGFFVKSQLGSIIAILAFLPIIILILLNKNMKGSQKAIAGGVAGVLLVVAALTGADFAPVSQESLDTDASLVSQITGSDTVYWVPGGSVYHLCPDVSDLQQTNQNEAKNQIVEGTVQEAVDHGKPRLTKKWQSEITQCQKAGFEGANAWPVSDVTANGLTTIPSATTTEEPASNNEAPATGASQ